VVIRFPGLIEVATSSRSIDRSWLLTLRIWPPLYSKKISVEPNYLFFIMTTVRSLPPQTGWKTSQVILSVTGLGQQWMLSSSVGVSMIEFVPSLVFWSCFCFCWENCRCSSAFSSSRRCCCCFLLCLPITVVAVWYHIPRYIVSSTAKGSGAPSSSFFYISPADATIRVVPSIYLILLS